MVKGEGGIVLYRGVSLRLMLRVSWWLFNQTP